MGLLELLAKLFGKSYLNKIIGTRTNVAKPIKMDKNSPFRKYSDSAFDDPEILQYIETKINEYGPYALSNKNPQELANFEANAKRLLEAKNKQTGTTPGMQKAMEPKPEAEIVDIRTQQKVKPEGIETLKSEIGLPEGIEPGSLADKAIKESAEYKMNQQGVKSLLDEDYKPPKTTTIDEDEAFEFEKLDKDPYRPGGPLDPAVGITRAGARLILENKGIKIGSKDPLDLVRENFGQDFLNDINNLSEEMLEIDRRGGSYRDLTDLLKREGLYDAPINKDAPKGYTAEEMKKMIDEADEKPMVRESLDDEAVEMEETKDLGDRLKDYDGDPDGLAEGGRIGYAVGTGLRLYKFFKDKGLDLARELKKAVDDIFPSGDRKLDADMVVDNMLEDLGVDRDMFDQKDISNLYGMAYDTISQGSVPKGLAGFMTKKGKGKVKTADEIEVSQDVKDKVEFDKQRMEDNFTQEMAPQMYERMQLKIKYPGITDDLIEKIMVDDNPQRKAEVLAAMDEAFKMMDKGMSSDEILNIIKNTTRTKQAGGGLSYLMGM